MQTTIPRFPGASGLRPTRRAFLVAAAAVGGGLLLGFRAVPALAAEGGVMPATVGDPFDALLRIAPDGTVTVASGQMEGGQGIRTGIATLVAEEMDAAWSQMRVEDVAGDPAVFGNLTMGGAMQVTGGSTSMPSSWDRYRLAGAAARGMLVAAAARAWGVPAAEVAVAEGRLSHPSGRSAGFGELAEAALAEPVPAAPRLKEPSEWRLIGNADLRRLDTAPKTLGTQDYTIDVVLSGMLTAVLARPPRFGGRVARFDPAPALAVPGVERVVEVPQGVAVLARDTWSAIRGRDALAVEWDDSAAETRGSAELMAEYRRLGREGEARPAASRGDAEPALGGATTVVEAEFEFPFLAHAAMEPLDAVVAPEGEGVAIWAPHQLPQVNLGAAAAVLGLDPARVRLHSTMAGGFFGRRAVPDADFVVEAAAVFRAAGGDRPVKVQWTREDDMAGGRYRPMYHHRVRAGLDAAGRPVAWAHRIVGQSILAGTPFEAFLVKDGIDSTSVEGATDMPYAVPNLHVDLVTTSAGVPVLWWRSVGHTHTAYAVETVIDDLARAAGRDPVEFRLDLLAEAPRHRAVLELAAARAGWGGAVPEGRARGVAVHRSFGSFVAMVAELSVEGSDVRVHKVTAAVDCGIPVNPDVIRAQVEGGIGFGLGAALHSELRIEAGRAVETNFDGFRCLRIDEMPAVEVHIVPSAERPTGIGEPGVPPIAPAVSNAILAATGRRLRRLPLATGLAT